MHIVKGFTLVELMITVAIIGLLAVVATPVFQNYLARTKVIEAFSGVLLAKTLLADFYSANGKMPADNSLEANAIEDGLEASNYISNSASTYKQLTPNSASIKVTLSGISSLLVHGTSDTLVITLNSSGQNLLIDCTNSTVPHALLPRTCK